MMPHLLSLIIWCPIAAGILTVLLPFKNPKIFRFLTVFIFLLQAILACALYFTPQVETGTFNDAASFAFSEVYPWIRLNLGSLGTLAIDYRLGADGIGKTMILLATLVMLVGAVASYNISFKQKTYYSLFLLLGGSVVGCFAARDLFLFFVFFEFILLPMYFLIGLWGGKKREYASLKFIIYTLVGSLLILVVMLGLFVSVIDPAETAVRLGLVEHTSFVTPEIILQTQKMLLVSEIPASAQVHSLHISALCNPLNYIPNSAMHPESGVTLAGVPLVVLAFWFFFVGFAIKLPSVPLHTWLPDAHTEAPSPVSVVLAGILLKVGAYGLIRFVMPIFPTQFVAYSDIIAILGMLSIIYGAMNALAMSDFKKMVAYSSVSHMGFVLLGLASGVPEGINGAVFQMFSHGVLSSGLFIAAGVLYDRTENRQIDYYGGLALKMPRYTAAVLLLFFASLGLPGFSAFIGEFMTLLGGFQSESVNGLVPRWVALLSVLGLIIGAGYFLWVLRKMFFGPFWVREETWRDLLKDLSIGEGVLLFSLVLLSLLAGIFPNYLFDVFSLSASNLADFMEKFNTR